MSGEQFVGASDHPLLADWNSWLREPAHVWAREASTLSARAVSLVCNDAFAAAMVSAKIRETHGPRGMMLRSAYSATDTTQTTAEEQQIRRQIEWTLEGDSAGTALDAGGELTRLELEHQLDWIATVMGDAWAVWVWLPGRPGARLSGCWRVVTPDRVCNPDYRPDDDRLQGGVEKDSNGQVIAIHVMIGNVGAWGVVEKPQWKRVGMYGPMGQRQVIHHTGFRLPGMTRGISMFAPALLMVRQIQGVTEAHVAGKRVQAMHPIIYKTDDEKELADAMTAGARLGVNAVIGPMSVLVCRYGAADVEMLQSSFQGDDLDKFNTTLYRTICAMWGLPWQVVLACMGDASLASARAGLDQNARTCESFGVKHENNVSRPIDEAILREEQARGRLQFGTNDWQKITAGRYSRPAKYSTDLKKDADTIQSLIKGKVSPTTAHRLVLGISYEDEAEQTARDIAYAKANGLPDPTLDPIERVATQSQAVAPDAPAPGTEPVAA